MTGKEKIACRKKMRRKQKPTKKQRIRDAIRNLRELGYRREKIRETIRRLEKSMEK